MATKTPNRTTPRKITPTKAGLASKNATAERESAAKKEKAEAPAPVPPPVPKEAVSLIDEKPKPVRRPPVPGIKGFKPLSAISQILKPEPPKAPEPEPEPTVVPEPEPVAVVEPEPVVEEEVKNEKVVHLKPPIIVRELATALGLKPFQVLGDLLKLNILVNVNQSIEPEIASKVCEIHGFVFEREKREKGGGVHKELKPAPVAPPPPPPPTKDEIELRAPIVTFMGHVDHGKTTLMDAIRKAKVAAGEAGGITQHIGAYSVNRDGHNITFLDTPGHAAFTAMRARGANVTDIVVLVVAADDGLMPQTLEALAHARAAKVQIIVAITKTDVPGANIDRVKGQLQEKGLQPEDWGGETPVVPVSAPKGLGIDELLKNILVVAEVSELKAPFHGPARGTVIEAQVEQGRGPTATIIVKTGLLEVGDAFICGHFSGKVKSLIGDAGQRLKEAGPSTPCKVLGFSGLPNAGDEFLVMDDERSATTLSEERLNKQRLSKLAAPERPRLENLFASLAQDAHKVIDIILKTDVQGSLEAVSTALNQIDSKKIDLHFVHAAVGPISESDVLLAAASGAIVVGFNVKTESSAAVAARREGVQIKLYSIIYELIDQVKEAMAGLLDPESRESVIGHALVKQVFELSRGLVAGCAVTDGRILRTGRARVLRGKQPIYDGGLATLRRFTEDVKEVRNGLECGIKLGDFNDYEVGDVIECYTLEKVAQKL
ncbi:MAG TPA: translation initiation factor IF-2 [Chthoniobacteraceae bacterium]|jgi:translation initiation factor IF-2|nr:translation initiation factor IF-2 [Chthoniobacteraceae bacterium]